MHIGKRRGMCELRVRVGSVRVGKTGRERDVVYISIVCGMQIAEYVFALTMLCCVSTRGTQKHNKDPRGKYFSLM